MTPKTRRIAISALALVGLASIVLPALPTATVQAAPNAVVAVVVEGVGTSTAPDLRWTRLIDADVLADEYLLGSVTTATVVGGDVVLTGSNGRTKRLSTSVFRDAQGLPSSSFSTRVAMRDPVDVDVAFIGDSVGVSIAGTPTSEFRMLTDGTFTSLSVDTLVGRFITKTPPAPSGVDVANALPTGLDVAIVELGYNPSTNMAADIDAMMAALTQRGVQRVVWINMAEIRLNPDGSAVFAKANAEISKARSRWPNLVVADWRRTVAEAGAESAPWFVDGVHLTTTGQAEFALWVRQLVGGTGPIGGNFTSSWRFAPNQRIELQVVGQKVIGPDGVARTIPSGVSAVATEHHRGRLPPRPGS